MSAVLLGLADSFIVLGTQTGPNPRVTGLGGHGHAVCMYTSWESYFLPFSTPLLKFRKTIVQAQVWGSGFRL